MVKHLCYSVVFVVMAATAIGQTVQDGIKFVYYEQFTKAKEVFNKILAANPADPEANYWLGQAYINDDDIAAAKAQYAKAMTATNQNPLIMIGMGHVELLEKKNAEAKAHFEAALEPTKSKKNKKYGDPELLKAIGRANADGGTENGDPVYGIEKLQQAAELDPKDPEIMVNIGISHLKRGGEYGGEAKRAFDMALERDPNYAAAYMRIGRIFESQNNKEKFLENYNKAIELDPKYAPAYLALYTYYQNRDVNKAGELLSKYVSQSEKSRDLDYFEADYKLRSGKYPEALSMAQAIEAGLNGEQFPKIHKLYSVIYDRLGDSIKAKNEIEAYINQVNPAKITAEDYATAAALYIKSGDDSLKAEKMVDNAVAMDTVLENKLSYMKALSDAYGASKKYPGQYAWLRKMMDIRSDTTARNYYFLIDAAIKAEEFLSADTFAQAYIASYPDQNQGYYFRTKAALLADKDTSLGTAIPAIDQYDAFMMQDTAKNKNKIINNIGYKVYYYANKAQDYEKAIAALDEILALDPGNSYALTAKEQLMKILKKSGTSPKPGSGGQTTPSSQGTKNSKPAGR